LLISYLEPGGLFQLGAAPVSKTIVGLAGWSELFFNKCLSRAHSTFLLFKLGLFDHAHAETSQYAQSGFKFPNYLTEIFALVRQ